jgi:hypothetical protein
VESEIHATTLVDAKVKAGGSIFIYGKPKQINKEVIYWWYYFRKIVVLWFKF